MADGRGSIIRGFVFVDGLGDDEGVMGGGILRLSIWCFGGCFGTSVRVLMMLWPLVWSIHIFCLCALHQIIPEMPSLHIWKFVDLGTVSGTMVFVPDAMPARIRKARGACLSYLSKA